MKKITSKFPRFIKITAKVRYKIEFVDSFTEEPGEVVLGECSRTEKIIRIKSSLSHKAKLETLIHEVCHAMIGENAIKVSHDHEETMILTMERPIYRLLKANGWI